MRPGGRDSPSGAELAGTGIGLAAAFVLPLLGGLAVDRALHSGPLGTLAGVAIGIAAAIAVAYTRFRSYL